MREEGVLLARRELLRTGTSSSFRSIFSSALSGKSCSYSESRSDMVNNGRMKGVKNSSLLIASQYRFNIAMQWLETDAA